MNKKRKLQDIDVEEISLVDKAANRHVFAIVKNQNRPDINTEQIFNKIFPPGAFLREAFLQGALPTDDMQIIDASLREIAKYWLDFPAGLEEALTTLASYGVESVTARNIIKRDVKKQLSSKDVLWPSILIKALERDGIDVEELLEDEDEETPVQRARSKQISQVESDEIDVNKDDVYPWTSLTGQE